MLALPAQPRALLDPEPVLLVDDHEPETAKVDALLNERVGAHHALDLSRGQDGAPRLPLARLERRGREGQAHAERLEQLAERHEVLLGQDLGRRHDRRLVAGFDRRQHPGRRRSSCLSRRRLAGGDASGAAPPCRGGSLPTRVPAPPSASTAAAPRSRATRSPRGFSASPRARATRERRIASPSWSSRPSSNERRRLAAASAASASGKCASLIACASPTSPRRPRTPRKHLFHFGGVRLDEPPHDGAERALGQPLGERIHRDQAARVQALVLAVLDDLVVRLLQDDRALVAPDTAVQHELLAALEDARQIPPAEPAGGGVAARVAQHDGERHAEPSGAAGSRRRSCPSTSRPGPGRATERRQPVRSSWRSGTKKSGVLDGAKPLPLELTRALRADAFDELQRRREIRRRGGLLHGGPCAIQCLRFCPRQPQFQGAQMAQRCDVSWKRPLRREHDQPCSQADTAAVASESGLDARHDGWKAPARARVHPLPQGRQGHEGHLRHTRGRGVGPSRMVNGGRPPPPPKRSRVTTSSSSWPSSSSSVSPPSVSKLGAASSIGSTSSFSSSPSSWPLDHLLPRSFSSPSPRAAGARPAPVRGARSSRDRRTAAASTPP